MLEMPSKKLWITDTILRDAHQSQAATRMKLEDMLPACEILDNMGYWSIECWGGATFDACMRFLNEDPWERLRILRKAMPKTKLQMLLRAQNLLGYRHYADDVVDSFSEKWFVSREAVEYAVENNNHGAIPNATVLKDSLRYAEYKESTAEPLKKPKARSQMIAELENVIEKEILPLQNGVK